MTMINFASALNSVRNRNRNRLGLEIRYASVNVEEHYNLQLLSGHYCLLQMYSRFNETYKCKIAKEMQISRILLVLFVFLYFSIYNNMETTTLYLVLLFTHSIFPSHAYICTCIMIQRTCPRNSSDRS